MFDVDSCLDKYNRVRVSGQGPTPFCCGAWSRFRPSSDPNQYKQNDATSIREVWQLETPTTIANVSQERLQACANGLSIAERICRRSELCIEYGR